MTLRTDYTNATASTDVHPSAHNDTNAAVNTNTDGLAALSAAAKRRARIGPAGRWVWAWDVTTIAAVAVTAQQARALRIQTDQAFDAVSVEVTVAVAASTYTVGLYTTDSQGMPTGLAASSATDSSTIGQKTLTFVAQPAGLYWIAALPSHPITVRMCATANPLYVMHDTNPATGNTFSGWFLNGQTVLPNPFSGAWVGTSNMPAAQVRLA